MVDINNVSGSQFQQLNEGTNTSLDSAGGDFDSLMGNAGEIMGGDSVYFLKLQQQMSMETRAFETISNVLKARDEADKSAIRNVA